MDKTVIEYDIPIQSKEQCDKQNETYKKLFGDHFTPIKPTEEHVEILMEKLLDGIEKVDDEGGWYTGDRIKVRIELMYDPEDK